MNAVAVIASGALTAAGDLESTWSTLMDGCSSLTPVRRDAQADRYHAGQVSGLDAELGTYARLNRLIRLLLGAIPHMPEDTALITATTKGAPDELLLRPAGPWPGQPWDVGDHIRQRLGLRGPASTVSAACASGSIGLIQGCMRIANGESKTVLVIGLDILSRFVLEGFAALQALSPTVCRPFDKNRDGLCLGEGAGFMLLAAPDEARRRKWPVPARITGWGAACDAAHITAPSRKASGLKAALDQATNRGRLPVGGINAHGTGTLYNDSMEITAFTSFRRTPPPFHSVKGAIGHCLGAAGVIEAALAVKSLHAGALPPTVGLLEPEIDTAQVSGSRPLHLRHPSVLTCNSGFGGINAAVLLEKG